MLILCMWLQVKNKVKVTHQGEGHIKVKVKRSLQILCSSYFQQGGGLHSTEMRSCFHAVFDKHLVGGSIKSATFNFNSKKYHIIFRK